MNLQADFFLSCFSFFGDYIGSFEEHEFILELLSKRECSISTDNSLAITWKLMNHFLNTGGQIVLYSDKIQ
jgi:hypothetical protein